MQNKIIYAVAGLFNTPNEIIHAAEKVRDAGYKKFDVNTPYPVHGMDRAMGLKPSRIAYLALVLGLSGLAFAFLFMSWVGIIDYPMIIGGKPLFAPPAFVPITFEVTVLLASVGTVVGMFFFFFKLPNYSHPLHDTEYIKAVSSDKYGLIIQASDKNFTENEAGRLLSELGAYDVRTIYYDEEEFTVKHIALEPKFLGFLLAVGLLTAGMTYFSLNYVLFWPPFNWMTEQFKIYPQEKSEFFADGKGMRKPVEGTVARGFIPYEYANSQPDAAKFLFNPLLPDTKVMQLGKNRYDTFCSPCHGYFGKGDSRLRGQFPAPPSLHSDKVRNWTDGDIYHVITVGQNIMPPYDKQISREERWAVVHYLRALQRSQNAKETDIQ